MGDRGTRQGDKSGDQDNNNVGVGGGGKGNFVMGIASRCDQFITITRSLYLVDNDMMA